MADTFNDYEFVDKQNMHKHIRDFAMLMSKGYDSEAPLSVDIIPKQILICGLGNSGVPGDILKNYLDTKVTIDVVKDCEMPSYVNHETLVFVLSYSGNTEETIECYRAASQKRAKVVIISTGGKIETVAKLKGDAVVKLPAGYPSRAALPLLFFAMLKVLVANKIIGDKTKDVKAAIEAVSKDWYESHAKELALKIKDKVPVLYASKRLSSAAQRWKAQINENAKTHCFADIWSEMDHNEICGFEQQVAPSHVIMLIDEEDSQKMKKRMDVTKELLTAKGIEVTQVRIRGEHKLARLFSSIYLGDWVSFYLAVLYKVNPTSTELGDKLRSRL